MFIHLAAVDDCVNIAWKIPEVDSNTCSVYMFQWKDENWTVCSMTYKLGHGFTAYKGDEDLQLQCICSGIWLPDFHMEGFMRRKWKQWQFHRTF